MPETRNPRLLSLSASTVQDRWYTVTAVFFASLSVAMIVAVLFWHETEQQARSTW